MIVVEDEAPETVAIGAGRPPASASLLTTFRRLRRLVPELTRGLLGTLALAAVATGGKIVIPVVVQQTLDRGLTDDGADLGVVAVLVALAAVAVMLTATASFRMNVRLYRLSEGALATLRVRAFRHIHDLSMLSQSAQRRGSLTSRVTSDVDQMSQFLQFGGVMLLISMGQMLVSTVLMLVYSWPLALLVYAVFGPLVIVTRLVQRRLAVRYAQVRERVGDLLGAVSEAVVGAPVVRAYGAQDRTERRIDHTVERYRDAQTSAQRVVAWIFAGSELVAACASAGIVVVGVALGVGGSITTGRLVAFLFLMTLFVMPIQSLTEVLNDAANAFAGLRRVLDVLDIPTDVRDPADGPADRPAGWADAGAVGPATGPAPVPGTPPGPGREAAPRPSVPPGPGGVQGAGAVAVAGGAPGPGGVPGAAAGHGLRFGRDLPAGPLGARFAHVGFAYPGGPPVLHDITLEIAPRTRVAVVGETGSGKTTLAKLLTRLMDPTEGAVLIGGVPLTEVRFASLRRRVVMVPQDGFLFDLTIADNVRYGRPNASDAEIRAAFDDLGLADWLAGLPAGVLTRVGERGARLSAGERQLVALARAQLADPDLLVLDEATSAVDPATEVRLAGALLELTRDRTSVTIAHRLSTAQAAQDVVVVDAGRVAQQGHHRDLVAVPGIYQRLYRSWTAGIATAAGPEAGPVRPRP